MLPLGGNYRIRPNCRTVHLGFSYYWENTVKYVSTYTKGTFKKKKKKRSAKDFPNNALICNVVMFLLLFFSQHFFIKTYAVIFLQFCLYGSWDSLGPEFMHPKLKLCIHMNFLRPLAKLCVQDAGRTPKKITAYVVGTCLNIDKVQFKLTPQLMPL